MYVYKWITVSEENTHWDVRLTGREEEETRVIADGEIKNKSLMNSIGI